MHDVIPRRHLRRHRPRPTFLTRAPLRQCLRSIHDKDKKDDQSQSLAKRSIGRNEETWFMIREALYLFLFKGVCLTDEIIVLVLVVVHI